MTSSDLQTLAPKTIGVQTIPPDSLEPNPHNPRMLFDKAPLDVLRGSIAKVGILVPLTVYWSTPRKHYIILDGQRRWICAQTLMLSKVPVNVVAEPTLVQNIVTMFQIHKFREDWELMPTALKVEVLMHELKERNDRKLAMLTGLDQAVVVRCKKLLSYSRAFQELMLDPDPSKRVKADFFIELYSVRNDRIVNSMKWFSRDKFTERMLVKYLDRRSGLKSVTDFRLMKQYISNALRAGQTRQITSRLKEFTFDDSLTLEHLAIRVADISAEAKRLVTSIERMEVAIAGLVAADFYGEAQLWKSLERLLKLIRTKLLDAGRRPKE
jgi:ParB family chromosome partitioning protein